jgi:hypothetical protein
MTRRGDPADRGWGISFKVVWTLAAEPVGFYRSTFVTRTRAVATDPESRRRFRSYWAPMSACIILIRYLSLSAGEARR